MNPVPNDRLFDALVAPEARAAAVPVLSAYTRAVLRTARPSQVFREAFLFTPEDVRAYEAQPTRFRQLRFVLGRIRARERATRAA